MLHATWIGNVGLNLAINNNWWRIIKSNLDHLRDTTFEESGPFFSKQCHIVSAALVRQFSTNGDSHRAKHLRLKDEPLCKSHRKPALRLLKRRDGTRDFVVFSRCFPCVPPVNLNLRTAYNHMDAVIMCCDWDLDQPNILEISQLAASETFTQRRSQRIGAESPRANVKVNVASERWSDCPRWGRGTALEASAMFV